MPMSILLLNCMMSLKPVWENSTPEFAGQLEHITCYLSDVLDFSTFVWY